MEAATSPYNKLNTSHTSEDFNLPLPTASTPKDPINLSIASNQSRSSRASSTISYIGSSITQSLIIEPRPKFTIYKINVNSNNKRWIVHRRYSDFILLNKKLQKEFPSLCLSLPPKRWFRNNFNTYFIKKRKEGLQEFMRNLFALKQLFESKNVQMFFRLNDPPDPSEDLETSQMYCESLEQSCNDLRVVINQQGMEITRLNRDLQEMSFTQDKTNLDKNEATTGLLLAKVIYYTALYITHSSIKSFYLYYIELIVVCFNTYYLY